MKRSWHITNPTPFTPHTPPQVTEEVLFPVYNSSSVLDDMAWGAAMLYKVGDGGGWVAWCVSIQGQGGESWPSQTGSCWP